MSTTGDIDCSAKSRSSSSLQPATINSTAATPPPSMPTFEKFNSASGVHGAAVQPSPAVPTKFYQVCRLCLSAVGDAAEAAQLTVYDAASHSTLGRRSTAVAAPSKSTGVTGSVIKFNNNNQMDLGADGVVVTATTEAECMQGSSKVASDTLIASADEDDKAAVASSSLQPTCTEAQMELMQRIYVFLNIEVSTNRRQYKHTHTHVEVGEFNDQLMQYIND